MLKIALGLYHQYISVMMANVYISYLYQFTMVISVKSVISVTFIPPWLMSKTVLSVISHHVFDSASLSIDSIYLTMSISWSINETIHLYICSIPTFVDVHIYLSIYIYIYMYCIYIYAYIRIHIYIHIYIYTCMCIYIYIYMPCPTEIPMKQGRSSPIMARCCWDW